jgi:hypothetical protein
LKSLSKNIGIIIVDKKMNFKVYRKAKIRSKLDKNALISFLWKENLEKLALNSKYKEVIKLCEYVLKNYSLKQIHSEAIRVLKTRYSETYRLFLRDRENYTTLDDISLITGLKKNLVSLNKSIA